MINPDDILDMMAQLSAEQWRLQIKMRDMKAQVRAIEAERRRLLQAYQRATRPTAIRDRR